MSLVWINGTLIDKAAARVSPFDHGLLYGDGAWEHFRVFRGELFRPDKGVAHLFAALRVLSIDIGLSPADLVAAIAATVRANDRTEGYVRVVVTRGPGTLGPDPRKLDPQVIIIAEEYHPFPAELYDHGLHVAIAPNVYHPARPTDYGRTLGPMYLVWAKQAALRSGCLEAIVCWMDEIIRGIEGNLFLVRHGKVRSLDGGGYDVLLDVVPELARSAGILIEEDPNVLLGPVTGADLRAADEVFLGGTTCGVIAVISVGGTPIGPGTEGTVTRAIREAYRKLTRGW